MWQKFDQTVYVQVTQDALSVLHVQSGRRDYVTASFSSPRLAVAHFDIAQAALKQALARVKPFSLIGPILVMHQTYKHEGGLCGVEVRVLTDLAMEVGARLVYIWQGETLTSQQLQDKVYKSALPSPKGWG